MFKNKNVLLNYNFSFIFHIININRLKNIRFNNSKLKNIYNENIIYYSYFI